MLEDPDTHLVREWYAVIYTPRRSRNRFPENCVRCYESAAEATAAADPRKRTPRGQSGGAVALIRRCHALLPCKLAAVAEADEMLLMGYDLRCFAGHGMPLHHEFQQPAMRYAAPRHYNA